MTTDPTKLSVLGSPSFPLFLLFATSFGATAKQDPQPAPTLNGTCASCTRLGRKLLCSCFPGHPPSCAFTSVGSYSTAPRSKSGSLPSCLCPLALPVLPVHPVTLSFPAPSFKTASSALACSTQMMPQSVILS
ncbi:hypothetical protein N656DRAFT_337083 [Canariomyces notabilis]|uniref:Secreted protein n=1 Tax=Canariomyces notabilis TaxID=2074819 RepID=A0AAN6T960_9PEZI|nr:hypothetical protein N656DRAFT_337083 [Canariomyces arenarius]